MLDRCYKPNTKAFKDYGARGIRVCTEWQGPSGFNRFVADMGERPEGLSLDRRDNDGDYSPDNCRWATRREQQSNRRMTIRLAIDGEQYLLSHLAEISGQKPDTIKARHKAGLSYEEIISPVRRPINTTGLSVGGVANGARQKLKTHCPQGHEYTADNLTADGIKNGWRRCKLCHAARQRARNLRGSTT